MPGLLPGSHKHCKQWCGVGLLVPRLQSQKTNKQKKLSGHARLRKKCFLLGHPSSSPWGRWPHAGRKQRFPGVSAPLGWTALTLRCSIPASHPQHCMGVIGAESKNCNMQTNKLNEEISNHSACTVCMQNVLFWSSNICV